MWVSPFLDFIEVRVGAGAIVPLPKPIIAMPSCEILAGFANVRNFTLSPSRNVGGSELAARSRLPSLLGHTPAFTMSPRRDHPWGQWPAPGSFHPGPPPKTRLVPAR